MAIRRLDHRQRRWLVIGGALTAVVAVVMVTTDGETVSDLVTADMKPEGVLLTTDTHSASLEAVASKLERMLERVDRMEREQAAERERRTAALEATSERLEARMRSRDERARTDARAQYLALRSEMEGLGLEVRDLDAAAASTGLVTGAATPPAGEERSRPADDEPAVIDLGGSLPGEGRGPAPAGPAIEADDEAEAADGAAGEPAGVRAGDERGEAGAPRGRDDVLFAPDAELPDPVVAGDAVRAIFGEDPDRSGSRPGTPLVAPAVLREGGEEAPAGSVAESGIRRITSVEEIEAGDGRSAAPGGEEVFLPAGSILSGVLLNGLDAPSGVASMSSPMPVVVRLKHEAILPNYFQADVRECIALLAAYGDMSSERAYFRGEQLSCVLADGTVVQRELKSYAVGEDGKVGLRGRLVTRQGAFIANAILVGALEGIANAFDDNTLISVGAGAVGGGGASQAIAGGFGGAFERIADWYLEQADALFPVIEVDAGREIDVVLTGGLAFRIDLDPMRGALR